MANGENQPFTQEELDGLKSQLETEQQGRAALEAQVAERDARIAELEQAVTSKDSDMATLKQAMAESVASYKALVIQSNPEVLEELISGDTIESINESLREAKTLISKVRGGLEAEITSAKVPAGAPERTPLDLSALSPREKIQYAIGGKK